MADERINPLRRVRRRTSQVQVAFDLWLKQLTKTLPAYSSFFTNHVASTMHRYWPATFPEDYISQKALSDEWNSCFANEVDYTMGEADRQISALMAFADRRPEYAVLVLTSMGQAAVDDDEVVRTQLYIADMPKFMARMGIAASQWSPKRAMLPRYVAKIDDAVASVFRKKLGSLTINGCPIETTEHAANHFMMKLGQINVDEASLEVCLEGSLVDWKDLGLVIENIEDETGSYALHIPEGLMLIYDPSERDAKRVKTSVPTTQIAPMILRNYGLPVPTYMA